MMIDRSKHWKYPRTVHCPWSGGATDDDRTLTDAEMSSTALANSDDVVVTEKRDGENANLYSDHYHARSLDSRHHPSRNWVKRLHGRVKHDIPDGYCICGENMYAEHTIRYEDLDDYFEVFSVWDETLSCLSWDETLEWCDLLGLKPVPVLYRGPYDEQKLRELADDLDPDIQEGYVVRTAEGFHYDDFQQHVAKFVTAEFKKRLKNTDDHWMHQEIVPNELKESDDEHI